MMTQTIALTSSRLDRSLNPAIAQQQDAITNTTIAYCQQAFDQSPFFQALQSGTLSVALMHYVFLQYAFWRDQLHRWFGLCIVKANSGSDPDQKNAIMSMADHTFTDLRDGHNDMFNAFLRDIGVTENQQWQAKRSPATLAYERSFFEDFGYTTDNLYEALAALSGRELAVALRNQRLLECYFAPHDIPPSQWIALHADLEIDHFQDAIRPVLMHYGSDRATMDRLMAAVRQGIDRHIQYFDDLMQEYQAL